MVIMKKILTSIILGLLIIPSTYTFATSGACSYHGGVDCSLSGDSYSKVTCNDGWTNSSVYYVDISECSESNCIMPYHSGCRTEAEYSALQQQSFQSGTARYAPDMSQGSLKACRDEINLYQANLANYNSCTNNKSETNNYSRTSDSDIYSEIKRLENELADYCTNKYGANALYNRTKRSCDCKTGYILESGKCIDPEVKNQCLRNTNNKGYLDSKNMCQCPLGTSLIQGDCRTETEKCILWHGEHSITTPNSTCSCESGYIIANDGSAKCISNMPVNNIQMPQTKIPEPKSELPKIVTTTSKKSTANEKTNVKKTTETETQLSFKVLTDKKSTIISTTTTGTSSAGVVEKKKVGWFKKFISWFK